VTTILAPENLEAFADVVARRVIELLDDRQAVAGGAQTTQLVDAAAIAGLLKVTRGVVYEHRVELGAVELGSGSRPRLRFDPQVALEA
jgi:hypothetical protein